MPLNFKRYVWSRILMAGVMISGCTADSDDALVDYHDLQELSVDLALEIGESEAYLPGNLRDLVLLSNGRLLVSDRASGTIEQFDQSGNHVGTVAGRGEGPGELPSTFTMISGQDDQVAVFDRSKLAIFRRNPASGRVEHDRTRVLEEVTDRFIQIKEAASESSYYADADHVITLYNQREWTDYSMIPVAIVDEFRDILQDSLHLLSTPRPVTIFGESSITVAGMPPYQMQDRLRLAADNHYIIGRPDSSALYIYNSDHELRQRLPVNVRSRAVRSAEIVELLDSYSDEHHHLIRERIPDTKPPFLDFWVSEEYIWLLTNAGAEIKEIVALSFEGDFIGRLNLPVVDDIRYFRENRIYTLHKDPDHGHSIRIYEWADLTDI